MDGDTRGGSALSVRSVSGKPIKFVGVGEGMEDLEPFFPERMASRILGMGDIQSLLEKAQVRICACVKSLVEKIEALHFICVCVCVCVCLCVCMHVYRFACICGPWPCEDW